MNIHDWQSRLLWLIAQRSGKPRRIWLSLGVTFVPLMLVSVICMGVEGLINFVINSWVTILIVFVSLFLGILIWRVIATVQFTQKKRRHELPQPTTTRIVTPPYRR